MTEADLEAKAIEVLRRELSLAPAGARVVHRDAIVGEFPDVKRRISDHTFSVLAPGADILVFFDAQGRLHGWRDEGRPGSPEPVAPPINPEQLRKALIAELELPAATRLGKVTSARLLSQGWTHQAIVFPVASPTAEQVIRVWVHPQNLNVIQCLYGAEP